METKEAMIVTLVVYKLVLLGIGFWASKRTQNDADFYLGGRRLGPWVASLSSAASSSSAWTLLGVSGAAYTIGIGAIWLFPACMGGFLLNWCVVAKPLIRATKASGAVTLTEYLAAGCRRNSRVSSCSVHRSSSCCACWFMWPRSSKPRAPPSPPLWIWISTLR